jgi:hypothetical protein
MTSTHRVENIFSKYLLYYVHEIARKYPREKYRYSSFSDSVVVPLQDPTTQAELSLATASDTHIGGFTQQKSGEHWRPLGFFSRKLTDTESRYSMFDRELLAAHAAIKYFRHFCEGHAFEL